QLVALLLPLRADPREHPRCPYAAVVLRRTDQCGAAIARQRHPEAELAVDLLVGADQLLALRDELAHPDSPNSDGAPGARSDRQEGESHHNSRPDESTVGHCSRV